jgi:hypothetical protein
MVRPLDKIIEAEREIKEIASEYQKYREAIISTYQYIKNLDDEESIQLFKRLMITMESSPTLYIEFKSDILDIIGSVAGEAEILKIKALTYENHKYKDLREKFIQNFRRGLKELTNKEGLLKLNNLYYLILYGKIPLQDLDKYLEKIRDRAYNLDQGTQIRYARQEAAHEYLGVIIKGLLMDPTKYEPLYKQLIKTDNLKEFFEYLQEEYENLIPKKDVTF